MWGQLFIYSLTGFSLILDKRRKKSTVFSQTCKNFAEEQREFWFDGGGREASISEEIQAETEKENLNPPELVAHCSILSRVW